MHKHNEARRIVLNGNYDGVLFVENDMVLPENTLELLADPDIGADVVYGLYCNRHGRNNWLCFTQLRGLGGQTLTGNQELIDEFWGKPIVSQGVGLGCTLIYRHVLEKISFKCHPEHKVADDWMFAQECITRGFVQVHHLGVVCGHIAVPDNPRIIWPHPKALGHHVTEFLDRQQLVPAVNGRAEVIVDSVSTEAIYGKGNREEVHS